MDYRNARHATFADLGPDTAGFAYADLDADELDYYSPGNPRYGRTERFAPPRPFDAHAARRPARRGRAYVREPLRLSDKLKSFACVALALIILFLAANALLRANGAAETGASAHAFGDEATGATSGTDLFQAALDEATNRSGSDENPVSTPASQWAKGTMPHLYQKDAAWVDAPYAGGTMGDSGCGPTTLSAVYVLLTGDTALDPVSMASFAETNGYADDQCSLWTLMGDGARQLGLQSQELPADKFQILSALEAGYPVVAIMGPGDFTETGHFIALYGLDSQGRAVVYDCNSPTRSARTWDLDTIIAQAQNFWQLSA